MKLSEHVTVEEFTSSDASIRHGIPNIMDSTQTQKAKDLCENVFEPIRAYLGKPIRINSGFRSLAINKRVGGASSSQHTKGEAVDLDLHDRDLFEWILDNIEYDQIIYEFGTEDTAGWFHISYRKNNNRKQALRAIKVANKTQYIPYKRK